MRLTSLLPAAPLAFVVVVALGGTPAASPQLAGSQQAATDASTTTAAPMTRHLDLLSQVGRAIFRYDTFGDEQLWTGFLRMHEPLATLTPEQALGVGLKVDSAALPPAVVEAIRNGDVDLTDPAVTATLLRANAVVGVRGRFEGDRLASVGITCALCHSTVDDSVVPGVGRRLDGWAATDLNVGAILALSPAMDPMLAMEFSLWGPGKYDPRHHYFNGETLVTLNTPSLPVVIPPIYGLRHVGFETYTADGPISYWNAYVGVGQMGGHGTFRDRRLGIDIVQRPDLVTPKLFPLLIYQLGLEKPRPPANSFDPAAARRGRLVFEREAGCVRCHRGTTLTDVLSGPPRNWPVLHEPSEVGTEAEYASRSATKRYRTTPLRGLFQHPPYFHDGSAADLEAVVAHYQQRFGFNLSAAQRADLIAYLKSL